ncbi:O-antigen ligase family protein [Mesobacillus maritimus]|uniref:O-antigen ligase family protein n=1 Tax=Mesobacillus maritimus TaxID=1643336 RepID=UPI002040BF42|nr:O-antigen ligase family protein [Mesobacillus maritimus]MCM3587650.1 O-antigen ligase family protein [Mesobacillus maritimus]
MFWFLLLFPLLIYPWGFNPYYTLPKTAYLQIFVLAAWLFILLKQKYRPSNLSHRNFKLEALIAGFIGLAVLSTIFSVNPQLSLYGAEKRYEGLLTIFCYASLFLFSYRFLNEEKIKRILNGMVSISIVVSVYGILQHFLIDFLPRNSGKLNYDRSYAFFDNPNFFGSYRVLMIMLTTTFYLTVNSKKFLVFNWTAASLAFIALLYSGTRSGWVGVFCGILFLSFFVVLRRKALWKKWITLLASFALIVVVVNTTENGSYEQRVSAFISDSYQVISNQSTGHEGSSRLFIWQKSLTLIPDDVWLGTGPDTLGEVFPASEEEKQLYLGNPKMIVDKVHNEYLHIAVTMGIPALILYLSILFIVVRRAFQAAKKAENEHRIFLFGLLSAIFGYLAQAFFNISVVTVAPFFWSLLGMTLAHSIYLLGKNKEKQEDENEVLTKTA